MRGFLTFAFGVATVGYFVAPFVADAMAAFEQVNRALGNL